jgi:hypothetical protein
MGNRRRQGSDTRYPTTRTKKILMIKDEHESVTGMMWRSIPRSLAAYTLHNSRRHPNAEQIEAIRILTLRMPQIRDGLFNTG